MNGNTNKFKKPLFLQMILAGILSTVSITVFSLICICIELFYNSYHINMDVLLAAWSVLNVIIFICVPVSLSLLLFIHFTGLFKYIMYSGYMVMIVSVLLALSEIFLHIIIRGYNSKYILFFSVIIVLYTIFILKKIFFNRYLQYQKEFERLSLKYNFNEKIDVIITIVTNIIILILSLLFWYIFFYLRY